MGVHDTCCVGSCSNTRSRPHLIVKRSHVEEMKWHSVSTEDKRKRWEKQIQKGREDFKMAMSNRVCSNHIVDGRPTMNNPDPTLFLTPSDKNKQSPKKPSLPTRIQTPVPAKKK